MDKGGDARKKKKVKILFEFDSLQKMSMTLTYSLDSFFLPFAADDIDICS